MIRRLYIQIDRIVVDRDTRFDGRSIAAAVERELAAQFRRPGAVAALAPRNTVIVDGGRIGPGDSATTIGRRIVAVVAGGGRR